MTKRAGPGVPRPGEHWHASPTIARRRSSVSASFYSNVLGLRPLAEPDELSAVFRLEAAGVFLLFDPARASAPGRPVPAHGARGPGHIAFTVEAGGLDAFAVELRPREIETEREITWDEDGRWLFVRDPA